MEKYVTPEPPEGSPKKKQRTDVTDGNISTVADENIVIEKSTVPTLTCESRVSSVAKKEENIGGIVVDKGTTGVTTTSGKNAANESSEETSVFRRDSVMSDKERIAQLAKMTEAFRPAGQGTKKLSHAFVRQMSIQKEEEEQTNLCPKIEGRIVQIDDKVIYIIVLNSFINKDHSETLR